MSLPTALWNTVPAYCCMEYCPCLLLYGILSLPTAVWNTVPAYCCMEFCPLSLSAADMNTVYFCFSIKCCVVVCSWKEYCSCLRLDAIWMEYCPSLLEAGLVTLLVCQLLPVWNPFRHPQEYQLGGYLDHSTHTPQSTHVNTCYYSTHTQHLSTHAPTVHILNTCQHMLL